MITNKENPAIELTDYFAQRSTAQIYKDDLPHIDITRCLDLLNRLELCNEADKLAQLKEFTQLAIEITPSTYSPANLKYLFSYPDPIGVYGDLIANYLNSNLHTEECSPIFTHCEIELIEMMKHLVGYPEGDGIFYPGGTMCNLHSLVLALRQCKGQRHQAATIISDHTHYSIDNAISTCGVEHVFRVRTANNGVVDLEHLTELIESIKEQELELTYFCCMYGTTNQGKFDPLEEINKTFKLQHVYPWIHIDAAWGGAVFFSEHAEQFRKIASLSDSVTLDFHKILSAPLLCSALMVRDTSVLPNSALSDKANYLFNNRQNTHFNLGLKSLQCSREPYAFKLWLMIKSRGISYYQSQIKRYYHNAKFLRAQLDNTHIVHLVEPSYFNLCFWYLPINFTKRKQISDYSMTEQKQISELNWV